VRRALALKATGNRLLEVIGGRAVHPVNLKVGGFYRAPDPQALEGVRGELEAGLEVARELTREVGRFPFPEVEQEYLCVSLHHPGEYAITDGRIVSSEGLDIAIDQFEEHFLVGPVARYNNNFDQLSPAAQALAVEVDLPRRVSNPFQSILVRMVEVCYAFEEAARLLDGYQEPQPAVVEGPARAGRGSGCTEAPRGICYHRYDLDDDGLIGEARIVPPTSQNQRQMEADLRRVVEANLDLPDEELRWRCEQSILG